GDNYSARFCLGRKLKAGFSPERIGQLYFGILESIINYPDRAIHQTDYINAAEKHQLLADFNNTETDFPANKTLVDLFEEQVAKRPHNIALAFGDNEFTVQELNESANQLANYLKHHYNIQSDDLIGIQLERSEWMIIAILGVLKSGGAYVPI